MSFIGTQPPMDVAASALSGLSAGAKRKLAATLIQTAYKGFKVRKTSPYFSGRSKHIRGTYRRLGELKNLFISHGKFELFHNIVGTNNAFITPLNDVFSTYMPAQGTGDGHRVGDQINVEGWTLRMLFGKKNDRPNTNFRLIVYRVRQQETCQYNRIFVPSTNNCLLDEVNRDRATVLLDTTIKPYNGRMENSTDEHTFVRKFFIKAPQKNYKFGTDGGYDHQNDIIWVGVWAYDAFGSLSTDNVGYVQIFSDMKYRDV